jgi:hypothetical protein
MLPLENADKSIKVKKAGRSSLGAIPPADLSMIFKPKPAVLKEPEAPKKEIESLGDILCNSYKFVVNYGVFEPNFEWLPCEVSFYVH